MKINSDTSFDDAKVDFIRRERKPFWKKQAFSTPLVAISSVEVRRDWWAVVGSVLVVFGIGALIMVPVAEFVQTHPGHTLLEWVPLLVVIVSAWNILRAPFINWFVFFQDGERSQNISNDKGRSLPHALAIKDALLIAISKAHNKG